MFKNIKAFFAYWSPLWTGEDHKPSLKAVLAIAFSIDFITNLRHAIYKWNDGRSLEGLSLVLGIEAGLVAALLGITAWSNMTAKRIDNQGFGPSNVTVEHAESVVGSTKAETANVGNVEQMSAQNVSVESKID